MTPSATVITKKSVKADLANYGAFVNFTDEVSLYHEDGKILIKESTDNLGAGAGTAIESLLFAEAEANAGIDYLTVPEASTIIGLDLAQTQLEVNLGKKFKSMINGSKNIDTKTVREAYVGFINSADIMAIEGLTDFTPVNQYGYSDGLMVNEVGTRRGVRFVSTINAVAGQITILAEEALGEVSVRGKGRIQTIVNALGSAGSADPLDQRQTVGAKFQIAPKMLRPEWAAICAIV